MAVSAEQLARELRAFDGRRALVKALRRSLTRVAKPAVTAAKANAVDILPHRGGLGRWVAASRIGVRIGYAGRSAGVRIRGSRKSLREQSDLARIDAGRVRAPSWGWRTAASWHTQTVEPGWFTTPMSDAGWRDDADAEVDAALDEIRRG